MIYISPLLHQQAAVRKAALLVAARSTVPPPWRSTTGCKAGPQIVERVRQLSTRTESSYVSPSTSKAAARTHTQRSDYHHDAGYDTTFNDHIRGDILPPSSSQLRSVMMQSALPMIGFGFMDQTIMIHAGNAIDCTIGVSLGLSTLAAAAVGQIVANTGALVFGESLEHFFTRFLWMKPPCLNAAQLSLAVVEKARFSGTFLGLVAGCILGLANLLFIDTQRSRDLKINKALVERKDYSPFEIYVSNHDVLSNKHQPATTLAIRGPDVDGILAILLTAMKEEGYSVIEMSAKPKDNGNGKNLYEEIFVVRRRGQAIPEDELAQLAKKLLNERISVPEAISANTTGTCNEKQKQT